MKDCHESGDYYSIEEVEKIYQKLGKVIVAAKKKAKK